MELEELKASWHILNERLEQNEILNKRIIKEMITKRTMGARDRLIRAAAGGIVFCLLAMVALVARNKETMRIEMEVIAWCSLVFVSIYSFVFIWFLSHFDVEKCTLAELKRMVIKLKRILRLELIWTIVLVVVVFIAIFFIHHHYRSGQQMLLDLMMILLTIPFCYLGYKFIDKRSVDEIEKGLEELKEFEESESE